MHPILSRPSRLALYVVAWIPIAGMLSLAVASSAGIGFVTSVQMMAPAALVYAVVCLSTWYTCRVLRLESTRAAKLLATHAAAALLVSAMWTLLVTLYADFILEATGSGRQFVGRGVPAVFASGVLLYLLSVALHYVLLAAESSQEARLREKDALALARQAELTALRAQLNPHFLFNSLNSISAMTTANPAGAREMCVLLADFLRATLGVGNQATIPLEEELDLARRFLDIEKVRFGSRLRVEVDAAGDVRRCSVPPLLLQPLVENAVNHGVAEMTEGGCVRIEAQREDSDIVVAVENTFDPDSSPGRREGLGLTIVRRRLQAIYGGRAALQTRVAGDRYRVKVVLPVEAT